ncbi:hypothetical protein C8R48DRAFT_669315 [Suillus tomentosus]|nr:hypothetical protein C8R48DRAFT_669315 [Suillus tomentosus]
MDRALDPQSLDMRGPWMREWKLRKKPEGLARFRDKYYWRQVYSIFTCPVFQLAIDKSLFEANEQPEPLPSGDLHNASHTQSSSSSIPYHYPDHNNQHDHIHQPLWLPPHQSFESMLPPHEPQPHQSSWAPPPQLHHAAMSTMELPSDSSHDYLTSTLDRGHQGQLSYPSLDDHHTLVPYTEYCQPQSQNLPLIELAHPKPYHAIPSSFFCAWPQSPTSANQTAHAGSSTSAHAMRQQGLSFGQSPQPREVPTLDPNSFLNVPISRSPESSDRLFEDVASLSSLSRRHRSGVAQPKSSNPAPSSHSRAKKSTIVNRGQYSKKKPSATKTASQSLSDPSSGMIIVPGSGTRGFLGGCKVEMRVFLFNQSLLPSNQDLITMVDSSWRAVAARQNDGVITQWASNKLIDDPTYMDARLIPVLEELHKDMEAVVRIFVFHKYNLQFDYTVAVDNSDIIMRAHQVEDLVANDAFVYGQISVDNVAGVTVAFANPTIVAVVTYLLRDSEHRYYNYIGTNRNFKPLLIMVTTLCRWALLERRTGLYIQSTFFSSENEVHHSRYISLYDALTPSEVAALTQLFTNGSALT